MISYEYTAKNKDGQPANGIVEAETESAAAKLLIAQNLTPLDIKVKESGTNLLSKFTNKVRSKDRIILTRQLATLINAGLPLTQSLRTVLEQTDSKPLKEVMSKVVSSVEGGNSFAD